eukprot:14201530-Alexandrium_andersonii.AAC.1
MVTPHSTSSQNVLGRVGCSFRIGVQMGPSGTASRSAHPGFQSSMCADVGHAALRRAIWHRH